MDIFGRKDDFFLKRQIKSFEVVTMSKQNEIGLLEKEPFACTYHNMPIFEVDGERGVSIDQTYSNKGKL